MADIRFFQSSGPFSLRYIADRIGAEPPAPETGGMLIYDIGALETARDGDLSLFCDAR